MNYAQDNSLLTFLLLLVVACWLVWAETGYILQSATLYLCFSESKRRAKDFRRSNAAAKARLPLHTSNYRR